MCHVTGRAHCTHRCPIYVVRCICMWSSDDPTSPQLNLMFNTKKSTTSPQPQNAPTNPNTPQTPPKNQTTNPHPPLTLALRLLRPRLSNNLRRNRLLQRPPETPPVPLSNRLPRLIASLENQTRPRSRRRPRLRRMARWDPSAAQETLRVGSRRRVRERGRDGCQFGVL